MLFLPNITQLYRLISVLNLSDYHPRPSFFHPPILPEGVGHPQGYGFAEFKGQD